MIVLLVGHSGTGKSTVLKKLKEKRIPNLICEHLDQLTPEWAWKLGIVNPSEDIQALRARLRPTDRTAQTDETAFLVAGLAAIGWRAARDPGKDLVIDVGAGFLHAPPARNLHLLYPVVFFHADPCEAHGRLQRCGSTITFEQYEEAVAVEREAAFDTANFKIDTTLLDEETASQRLAEWLGWVLGETVSGN